MPPPPPCACPPELQKCLPWIWLHRDMHELWPQLFLENNRAWHEWVCYWHEPFTCTVIRWDHDLEETAWTCWSRVPCVVDNVFINFAHRSLRTLKCSFCFNFRNFCLPISFTLVMKWSFCGDSAVGEPSASGMTTCSSVVNSDLASGSFWIKISIKIKVGVDLQVRFARRNWPLTSRDVYFLEMHANWNVNRARSASVCQAEIIVVTIV